MIASIVHFDILSRPKVTDVLPTKDSGSSWYRGARFSTEALYVYYQAPLIHIMHGLICMGTSDRYGQAVYDGTRYPQDPGAIRMIFHNP